jgi:hypothetical protein
MPSMLCSRTQVADLPSTEGWSLKRTLPAKEGEAAHEEQTAIASTLHRGDWE